MVLVIFSDIIHPSTLNTSLLHSLPSGLDQLWLLWATREHQTVSLLLDHFIIQIRLKKAFHGRRHSMYSKEYVAGYMQNAAVSTTLSSDKANLRSHIWTGKGNVSCHVLYFFIFLTHLWLVHFVSLWLTYTLCLIMPRHLFMSKGRLEFHLNPISVIFCSQHYRACNMQSITLTYARWKGLSVQYVNAVSFTQQEQRGKLRFQVQSFR